jgi:hypothetical protein
MNEIEYNEKKIDHRGSDAAVCRHTGDIKTITAHKMYAIALLQRTHRIQPVITVF